MKITLRKVFAFIVAFFVAGLLIEFLRLIGPVIGGYLVMAFNIPGGPNNAMLLESIGGIFLFVIVLYVSIKVYKRMARVTEEDKAAE